MKISSKTNLYILIFSSIFLFSCHRERFKKMQVNFIHSIIEKSITDYEYNYDYILKPYKRFYLKKRNRVYRGLSPYDNTKKTKGFFLEEKVKKNAHYFNMYRGWGFRGIPIRFDSLALAKKLLKTIKIGGYTNWSYPEFLLVPSPPLTSLNRYTIDTISHSYTNPPPNRIDLVTYYYIYYGLFDYWNEEEDIYKLKLVDMFDSSSYSCSCSRQDPILQGSDILDLYDKMPPSKCNVMLRGLYVCYQRWLLKVERVGWAKAKKLKLSPFDDCSCRIERIPFERIPSQYGIPTR